MKKLLVLLGCVVLALGLFSPAQAASVQFYLDAAPNASGSPLWPAFRDAAYSSIYNGTFVNQAHSSNPANLGTGNYDVQDYTVYSFGDLGKRLMAFYYNPEKDLVPIDQDARPVEQQVENVDRPSQLLDCTADLFIFFHYVRL